MAGRIVGMAGQLGKQTIVITAAVIVLAFVALDREVKLREMSRKYERTELARVLGVKREKAAAAKLEALLSSNDFVGARDLPSEIKATTMDSNAYAPTGYPDVASYPDAELYPARVELQEGKIMDWGSIKLPEKLPIHGLRIVNRMPQLGVVLPVDDIQVSGVGTKFDFRSYATPKEFIASGGISADDLLHSKYPQMYEPTTPYSIETGTITAVPGNCFMTMPQKGLKVYSVTYKDGSKKSIALLPMLGPYGNEPRFECFPPKLLDSYRLREHANVEVAKIVGIPDTSGYLQSFTATGGGRLEWDEEEIEKYVVASNTRQNNIGNYVDGHARLYNVFTHFPPAGLECLVVGSAPHPWVEGILLDHGAAHVTTSEYQVPHIPPTSKWASHMTTIHHEKLLANPTLFDMIVTFSSIEHDGLGRYHDPMSPGADLQQMRNLYDLLKPGGLLVLEVPLNSPDSVDIPQGRQYGPLRYPELVKPFILKGMYHAWKGVIQVGEEPGIGGFNKVDTVTAQIKKEKADGSAHGISVLQRPFR